MALFGSTFGAQNWYMGHQKRAAIGLSLTFLAMLMLTLGLASNGAAITIIISALALATNVYWGIIDFFRILSGHAKDVDGLYIMTKNQHAKKVAHRNLFN